MFLLPSYVYCICIVSRDNIYHISSIHTDTDSNTYLITTLYFPHIQYCHFNCFLVSSDAIRLFHLEGANGGGGGKFRARPARSFLGISRQYATFPNTYNHGNGTVMTVSLPHLNRLFLSSIR